LFTQAPLQDEQKTALKTREVAQFGEADRHNAVGVAPKTKESEKNRIKMKQKRKLWSNKYNYLLGLVTSRLLDLNLIVLTVFILGRRVVH